VLSWGFAGEADDRDDQAQTVHGQAALASRDALGGIVAGRGGGNSGGRVDTLGVEHHQGRVLQSAVSFTDLAAQGFMDGLVRSVIPTGGEMVVRRSLLRQVVRDMGPVRPWWRTRFTISLMS
jgi:hypothetical protein